MLLTVLVSVWSNSIFYSMKEHSQFQKHIIPFGLNENQEKPSS